MPTWQVLEWWHGAPNSSFKKFLGSSSGDTCLVGAEALIATVWACLTPSVPPQPPCYQCLHALARVHSVVFHGATSPDPKPTAVLSLHSPPARLHITHSRVPAVPPAPKSTPYCHPLPEFQNAALCFNFLWGKTEVIVPTSDSLYENSVSAYM